MGCLVLCITILTASAVCGVWMQVEKRRNEREIAEAAAESADRAAHVTVVAEADRIVRAAMAEILERQIHRVIAVAETATEQAAFEENLRHLDNLAEQHPMPKRPASPHPAPSEPWQLNTPDSLEEQ